MTAGSNLEHLADFDAALASLGSLAEQYFVDDANTALIKTRQFAERLSRLIAAHSGLSIEDGRDFIEVLHLIRAEGVAGEDIVGVLHRVRKAGNLAVHSLEGERREAFQTIRLCHRLSIPPAAV